MSHSPPDGLKYLLHRLIETKTLWSTLAWLTKLRSAIALIAYGTVELTGRALGVRLPHAVVALLLALALATNGVCMLLLRRWQEAPIGRLRLIAHAQLVFDLVTIAASVCATGGGA